MKNLYLTSIFCICAALNSAQAADAAGDGAADPCAEFRYSTRLNMTTSYNYDYDRRSLTLLGQKYGLVEPGMHASGLSLFGIDWSVSLNTVARVGAGDTICVLPTSLDVFIGFREPTIYIDNGLKKDGCRYNLVLRHEHQHQQVSIAALEYFMPRIRAEIQKALPVVRPRAVASLSATDAATEEMNGEYIRLIRPLVNDFKATLLYEQKKLDNRENYRFESGVCKGRP